MHVFVTVTDVGRFEEVLSLARIKTIIDCLWRQSVLGTLQQEELLFKGNFLYSAVSSPQHRSKRFTLYFPGRPVHSDTTSASLGSIHPYATINARRLLLHITTTVYCQVLMYTAE